jgi:hypothetical protein
MQFVFYGLSNRFQQAVCPEQQWSSDLEDRGLKKHQINNHKSHYQRGPLNLVSTIEEMLGKKSSGSGLENREYDHGDPLR